MFFSGPDPGKNTDPDQIRIRDPALQSELLVLYVCMFVYCIVVKLFKEGDV